MTWGGKVSRMMIAAIKFMKFPHLFSLESSFLVNANILFRDGVLKCWRLITRRRRPLPRSIPIQLLWIDENFIEIKKKILFVSILELNQRIIGLQNKIIERFTCKVSIDSIFVDEPGFRLGGQDSWWNVSASMFSSDFIYLLFRCIKQKIERLTMKVSNT